ncbi:hypothetical protein EV697_101300 [Bisgaardia hudsonensis]|uniref:Uncharacterized protein n=1 Tax=Bisgaardia hudsonensis TaxID=109472 RepID=A0A4R2N2V3_9PAST|nr:hypothetical protein [Bisgaardia hudsonensis]QLB12625.1 hypothetical protein A6A11_02890 [Bisgaardia hudsonensis]TCP14167.1 hypothetical protein EV697_101300 [Bisgaardia hudsonensis]
MFEEKGHKKLIMLSILPVFIILGIDIFSMILQGQPKALSHLNVAVLTAQWICLLVFIKGEICNGQRARLININLYFLIYWTVWLILSVFSNYHYILTDIVSLCGIATIIAIWQQPTDPQMRKSILVIGVLLAGLATITSLFIFIELPIFYGIYYNVFAQILTGIILANLMLVISKNRLQGFISLLSIAIIIGLLVNAVFILGMLGYAYINNFNFINEFAWVVYFLFHLMIACIVGMHIFKGIRLEYLTLIILLFISANLPIWGIFSSIK